MHENLVRKDRRTIMENREKPIVICPACGKATKVITLFTDEPGEGIGAAMCDTCGDMEFILHRGKVTAELADPEEVWKENEYLLWEEIKAEEEYLEYLRDIGLRV